MDIIKDSDSFVAGSIPAGGTIMNEMYRNILPITISRTAESGERFDSQRKKFLKEQMMNQEEVITTPAFAYWNQSVTATLGRNGMIGSVLKGFPSHQVKHPGGCEWRHCGPNSRGNALVKYVQASQIYQPEEHEQPKA